MLATKFIEVADEKQLSRAIARHGRVDLLRVDEPGCLRSDRRGAEVLFQVLTGKEAKKQPSRMTVTFWM
ncbi:hypothetical protein [Streptomyces sp. NPDC098101]|uniref:hypothetical protein n=1 Tax=Streptomyces sp. NPDC098101 TaxID=3366096 RepID=UPI00382E9F88